MALIDFLTGSNKLDGDSNGSAFTRIKDAVGNFVTKKHRDPVASTSEAIPVAVKNDDVSVFLRGDRKGNAIVGNYIPELQENFEGATVNVQKWTPSATTFVAAQTTLGGYVFANTGSTASGAVAILLSQRLFYKIPRVPLQFKTRLRHNAVANSVIDFGFGIPTTTTLIVPNGTHFRLTSSGTIKGVITINSVEVNIGDVVSQVGSNGNTVGAALNMSAAYYTSGYFVYDIIVDDDNAVFTIQDTLTGGLIGILSLPVPKDQFKMWGATAVPVYHRVYNSAITAQSPVLICSEMQVLSTDWGLSPNMSDVAGNLGLTVGKNPFTGAPLTARANSTVPATATLSNTTAAYTQPDFGFVFAAVAGAETDYLIAAFTVPAGSKFLCEGVTIETYNQVVAVATTPTVMEWALGFNSSAASLATANSVRKQVGVQTFLVGALAGAKADKIDINFPTPEVTESGRFVQVALRMPTGTATATETFRGIVSLKGRFI